MRDTEPDVVDTAEHAAGMLSRLVRLDSSNFGGGDSRGERAVAELAAADLTDSGLSPELLESAPGRANLLTLWPGVDRSRPPLLVHGHLDVVPAEASDWSRDPFGGEVAGGFVWGRGTIDMKQFVAQLLTVVRQRTAQGRPPARDVLLTFTADEEDSGQYGAYWLAREHRARFDGIVDAMGEGGGFSLSLPTGRRLYPVGTGEKGMLWTRVVAEGRAGHGSMVNAENAVTRLAEAMARVGGHRFPVQLTPTVRRLLAVLADELSVSQEAALADPDALVARVELVADELQAALRHMANPTMLAAGYKANVVPGSAEGVVDARILPGLEAEFLAVLDQLLGPHVRRQALVHDPAHEGSLDGAVPSAVEQALAAEDPDGRVTPYLDVGGTDAKAFVPLGISCYGFTPLRFPADERHPELFHGVDERVPVDGLAFGVRVLDRLLDLV